MSKKFCLQETEKIKPIIGRVMKELYVGKCILCGFTKGLVIGLFFPDQPEIYGKTSKGAFRYCLCQKCFEDPQKKEKVETAIYEGENGN